nr:quinoprotein dehydrogenase-associated putative ABC transporter substrate-binding protein [Ramlibacter ginsenosidimutans]
MLAGLLACVAAGAQAQPLPSQQPQRQALPSQQPQRQALRVCADPDNLPYSRADGSGFENRIAQLVADDFGVPLEYAWLPDVRGFIRKTMGAGLCDVVIGVPVGFERTLNTRAYYRSSYVLVEPAGDTSPPAGFDDPRLRQWRIGVQLIGDDGATSPPGHALARVGATTNVVGYPIGGDTPAAARIMHALDRGELDAAFVWGPQAGYYAAQAKRPLAVHYVPPPPSLLHQSFSFPIAMGVRRGDQALRDRLDDFIARRHADIARILDGYGVPRVEDPAS